MTKVFGIGLPRTGTSSLSEALTILGYKTRHYPKYIERAHEYDALVDSPVSLYYKELDRDFPGSKFILTIRDADSWLRSCKKASRRFRWGSLRPNHKCGPQVYQCHVELLGCVGFNESTMRLGFYKHYFDVTRYFKDKPRSLLIYDLCRENDWQSLCSFLGRPRPNCDFPHRNKSQT